MLSKVIFIDVLTILLSIGFSQLIIAQNVTDIALELIRTRIETADHLPKLHIGGDFIHASVALPKFYESRLYKPAWSDDSGPLPIVDSLINAIKKSDLEGLLPQDYHLEKIEAILSELNKNNWKKKNYNLRLLVDLDLLLTDTFLIYASHLLSGRINPQTTDAQWIANRREKDFSVVLSQAISSKKIQQALKNLMPPQLGYHHLKGALAHYRKILNKGGWPILPEIGKLEKGNRNPSIIILRNRLEIIGQLDSVNRSVPVDSFDQKLESSVKNFQKMHGLDPDGVVGKATRSALNVPVENRVQQIIVNLERWRWLPQNLGNKYVLVNIANFELDVVETDKPVMTMRVVVGRSYRKTPVFSDKITYLVINPYWNVPQNIAKQDILPNIKNDKDYLASQKMKVFLGWGAEVQEINPDSVNWSNITANNLKFRFRQEPGPINALGRIKFMFPNQFDVYLHDTPARGLFSKVKRDFSSGCIRIEKPLELAEYVLQDNKNWTRMKISEIIESGVEKTVKLPEPIQIHLLYWTAWSDEDGRIHFREDIYNRDQPLADALAQEPPHP